MFQGSHRIIVRLVTFNRVLMLRHLGVDRQILRRLDDPVRMHRGSDLLSRSRIPSIQPIHRRHLGDDVRAVLLRFALPAARRARHMHTIHRISLDRGQFPHAQPLRRRRMCRAEHLAPVLEQGDLLAVAGLVERGPALIGVVLPDDAAEGGEVRARVEFRADGSGEDAVGSFGFVLELLGVRVGPASLVWPFGHHALSARGR